MAQPTTFVRARVRGAVDRVLVRVRDALDLPSRGELADLTQRLEQLDRRIAELAAERIAELSRPVPALPAPEMIEIAAEPAPEPVAEAIAAADEPQPITEPSRKNGKRAPAARTRKK